MKTIKGVIIGAFAFVIASAICWAELSTKTEGLERVPSDQVPYFATFWLAKGQRGTKEVPEPPWPMFPPELPTDLPVYKLGDNQFLVDDSAFQYPVKRRPSKRKASLTLAANATEVSGTASGNRQSSFEYVPSSRVFDSTLTQEGVGTFFNTNNNQTYATYRIKGFQTGGYYFVTSKTNLPLGNFPLWNTHTLEGYLVAPNDVNATCSYSIRLDGSDAKFFWLANFDGTYGGLFAPTSSIVSPADSDVVDLRTNHFFYAKTAADDAQGISQILLTFDGQLAADREADFPGDPSSFKFNSYFLPSGEHTLVQKVFNFGENGAPKTFDDDLLIDRLSTDSQTVTFTVTNNFAYINPNPISMEGSGSSLTIETPWTNALLTLNVMDSNSNIIQVLTNFSGDDRIVSFAWDGTDGNGNVYTNDTVTFKLNPTNQSSFQPFFQGQGPGGTIPQLTFYRAKPPVVGKISFAYQNLGIINQSAQDMLTDAHNAADFWGTQNFRDMKPLYRDGPQRVDDQLPRDQWLNDLLNVGEVWEVSHTAWGYSYPYDMPGGQPFITGNKTDRQGLFGDGNQFVSVRQISDKLKNLFDYRIYDYYQGPREIPIFYDEDTSGLWARFSFKHTMSSVYVDSCYSALTSLPMAFGIVPLLTYGTDFNASFFGWTIDEAYESSLFAPQQVHFSRVFNAAYILDPTLSLGMAEAAAGAGNQYGISANKYAVFGNPHHPYARH